MLPPVKQAPNNSANQRSQKVNNDSRVYNFRVPLHLRNNWYSENYLAGVAHTIEIGTLFGAAQDGRISSASRIDYAEAAAKVLTSTGHENKTYELAGSESFTKADLAQFISQATHKPVIYQNLSADDLRQGLIQASLPSYLIDVIVDADVQTAKGAMYSDRKDLEQLIGHKTTSIQDSIKAAL
jgi:NAD(P)H dehydrogenase (quinone)